MRKEGDAADTADTAFQQKNEQWQCFHCECRLCLKARESAHGEDYTIMCAALGRALFCVVACVLLYGWRAAQGCGKIG